MEYTIEEDIYDDMTLYDTFVEDGRGNIAHFDFFGSKLDAIASLKTLLYCNHCKDCEYCHDCSYCTECTHCIDCSGCNRLDDGDRIWT